MYSKETTLKLLQISNEILEIINDRDEMPNGDFQGCIEAQVMIAYQLGVRDENDRIQETNDAII